MIGIKVIIKVLLIVVRLSFLKLQLEKIHKTKSYALMAFHFVMGFEYDEIMNLT